MPSDDANTDLRASTLNAREDVLSVMAAPLQATEFLHLLLTQHHAEDAFDMERDDQAFIDDDA